MFKLLWRVLVAIVAVVTTFAVERALIAAWRMATGRKPPGAPEDPDSRWGRPLAWAMASGAAVGVTRLVVQRLAAAYYRKNTGRLPKSLRKAISEEASADG
jgi:hypothetical protein